MGNGIFITSFLAFLGHRIVPSRTFEDASSKSFKAHKAKTRKTKILIKLLLSYLSELSLGWLSMIPFSKTKIKLVWKIPYNELNNDQIIK